MSRRRLNRRERRHLVDLRQVERTGRVATLSVPAYFAASNNARGLLSRRLLRAVGSRWFPTPTGGSARWDQYELTDRGRVVADQLILRAYARSVYVSGEDGSFGEAMAWKQNPELAFYVARVRTHRMHARTGPDRFVLRFAGRLGLLAWPAPEQSERPTPAELGMAPPREGWDADTRAGYDAIRRRALETRQLAKSYSFAERHARPVNVRQAAMSANFGYPTRPISLHPYLTGHDPGDEDRRGDNSFFLDGAAETREG